MTEKKKTRINLPDNVLDCIFTSHRIFTTTSRMENGTSLYYSARGKIIKIRKERKKKKEIETPSLQILISCGILYTPYKSAKKYSTPIKCKIQASHWGEQKRTFSVERTKKGRKKKKSHNDQTNATLLSRFIKRNTKRISFIRRSISPENQLLKKITKKKEEPPPFTTQRCSRPPSRTRNSQTSGKCIV